MDTETTGVPNPFYDDGYDWRRDKVGEMIKQITSDPVEQNIVKLMLENYTEKEISRRLNSTLARVEWFMRRIDGWKRKKG